MTNTPRFNHRKYRAPARFEKSDRRWPDRTLTEAPDWCSVDLRDGNQALIEPMTPSQKREMFEMLLEVGFKEIEVGFPAASQDDFDFVRLLIEEDLIPSDVTIQVLTQARQPLIERTFESLKGARSAIVHLYNSTSTVQREQVFKKSKEEIREIAVTGARWVKECAQRQPETEFFYQYSPESFTGTEMDYAVSVCNAVIDVWKPTAEKKVIINLPATVEVSSPNVYADQVEWVGEQLNQRENVRISLHTHNDRGCGVAAAELGVMAGAERVEGTMLGNGERTGNMDIVTMAMNFYSQGIDPCLNMSRMDSIISVVEKVTQMAVHPRHPYAGELVFAAFSGSHQDAINKCMAVDKEKRSADAHAAWNVAYLPIDPRDLGRSYQEVIRINSQSGKGGVAFVLEQDYGVRMPRWMQVDFSPHIQKQAERSKKEVAPARMWELFQETYLSASTASVEAYSVSRKGETDQLEVAMKDGQQETRFECEGRGVVDAFVRGVEKKCGVPLVVVDYSEHSLGDNAKAEAISYVQLSVEGNRICAAGRSEDILKATMLAVLNAVARSGVILG